MDLPITDLLIGVTEVIQDVIHAVLLQCLTGVGLSKEVNTNTVLFIHVVMLQETTAFLLDNSNI